MDEAGGLTLRVLGEVDAIRAGVVVDLGGRRQRAALAALIIARGDVVSAETLAECVWGDEAADRGAGGLHAYVSHLRRRLQPDAGVRSRTDVITRVGRGYALSVGPLDVDAWRFERALEEAGDLPASERVRRLTAALALWRGPAYAEYADESWAATEIARLTELRAVARERLMDARLALGDSPVLVAELEALVAEDPLREERWGLLILALYRAHRQGDALVALRRARRTLASELGVEPGPGLRVAGTRRARAVAGARRSVPDAERRRCRGRRSTLPASRRRSGRGPVTARPPADRRIWSTASTSWPLLRRAVDDVRAGTGGTVLIEGSAGIGKTRLLAESGRLAAAAARAGAAGQGQRTRAGVRVRDRAPAVRTVAGGPGPARRALGRRSGRRAWGIRGGRRRRAQRRVVRRAARAVLADGQSRRRRSAAAVDRRRAVERHRVAALPRLSA